MFIGSTIWSRDVWRQSYFITACNCLIIAIVIIQTLDDAMHGFFSDDEGVDLLSSILDREKQSLTGHEVSMKRTTNNSKREKSHVGPSSEHASDDEMALMKGEDSYTVLVGRALPPRRVGW